MTSQYEIPSFLSVFYICVGKNVSWECSFFQWSKEHEGAFLIMKKGLLTSPLKFLTLGSGWRTWIKSLKIFIPIHLLSSIDDMQKKWSLKTWTFWQKQWLLNFSPLTNRCSFFYFAHFWLFAFFYFSIQHPGKGENHLTCLYQMHLKKSLKICSVSPVFRDICVFSSLDIFLSK